MLAKDFFFFSFARRVHAFDFNHFCNFYFEREFENFQFAYFLILLRKKGMQNKINCSSNIFEEYLKYLVMIESIRVKIE